MKYTELCFAVALMTKNTYQVLLFQMVHVYIFLCVADALSHDHMKEGRWPARNSVRDPRDTPEGFVSSES